MDREPKEYSRLLVVLGLFPLLLVDLYVGLPEGGFLVGGAIVLTAAAGVHLYGGERRAGAGWLVFGGALALVAVVDVTANGLSTVTFVVLLVAGLLLLVTQRRADDPDV